MKKLISLVLALVLCVVAMPVIAFADTTSTDGLFGVIVDADGNIVERVPMSRATYVNSILTIPVGGSFISYQYWTTDFFYIGYATSDTNGNYITTSNLDLDIKVESSATVGGDGKYEYDDGNNYRRTVDVSQKQRGYLRPVWSSAYFDQPGYFNGILINYASTPAKVRVIVAVDPNKDELDAIYKNL